jgi:Zn-dependent peptidase ImmA (M78 family)
MQLIIAQLQKLKIGWNERPLTEADFYRLCRRYGIRVTEMPLRVGGFHYRVLGRDYIAVDARLKPPEKLAVLFHELGHFLLHAPASATNASFHHVGRKTRAEQEADLFAYCCLVPRKWLFERDMAEISAEEGISAEVLEARWEIYRRYGV